MISARDYCQIATNQPKRGDKSLQGFPSPLPSTKIGNVPSRAPLLFLTEFAFVITIVPVFAATTERKDFPEDSPFWFFGVADLGCLPLSGQTLGFLGSSVCSEMEGNLPPGTLMPGAPFDIEPSFESRQQPFQLAQPQLHHGMLPSPAIPVQDFVANAVKISLSDDEDIDDGHDYGWKAACQSQWRRVKWTSDMVKLLVSAVAYIDEEVDMDSGGSSSRKRNHAMLKKKGKWKLVSRSMNERAFAVSPQQCEDKFNDLNKRYKRLTEILGRGTTCQIVENPQLLEGVKLSGKLREEAKKHLSSKHLHYEEMCSYHNRNRQCLLEDPTLQKSLRLGLRSQDDHGKNNSFGYDDNDDYMTFSDDDYEEDDEFNDVMEATAEYHHHISHGTKKLRIDQGETQSGSHLSEIAAIDVDKVCEGSGTSSGEKKLAQGIQIEKQRLKIKNDMLKMDERHFKWLGFSEEKDRELAKMRLEHEKMRLENERLELELNLKEIEMGIKPKNI
ncbi:uncharacterized protein LOC124687265 [Lolium rigidum]|uniref:uncharacterized protein LOC124687265 n=1 Tax=Lolium rigidum TaxID=89674 RepID=UPI001F5D03F0|nr:uncharacterized protein LOC124687265 [Lolium rigidum]